MSPAGTNCVRRRAAPYSLRHNYVRRALHFYQARHRHDPCRRAPGTPASGLSLAELEKRAVREAKTFRDAGVHGLRFENMHDKTYLSGGVCPEIVAALALMARAVKLAADLPGGVQIPQRSQ